MGTVSGSFVLLVAALFPSADFETPGLALERQILKGRTAVKHGRVVISVKRLQDNRPLSKESEGYDEVLRFAIEFDGESIRMEKSPTDERRVVTPRVVLSYDPRSKIVDVFDFGKANRSQKDDTFPPWLFGITDVPFQAIDNYVNELPLAFTDRRNEQVTDEDLNGTHVKHVQYDRVVGSHFDLWIDPDRLLLLRTAARSQDPKSVSRTEMNVEWALYPGDVWFPRSVSIIKYKKNKVEYDELATTDDAAFNKRPTADRFTLTSFGLEPGQVVRENGATKLWDGKAIRSEQEVQSSVFQASRYGGWRWLLLLNAGVLALAAVLIAAWRWRRASW